MSTAGVLLRRARKEAGLTQAELSKLADVPQSVISAYERGRRDPAVNSLTLLLRSAGFSLAAVPEPETLRLVRNRAAELTSELEKLGGTNVSVFGSVARGDDKSNSDVDLLVDVDETVGLFKLMRMKSVAEEILGRSVDLIPREGLKIEVANTAVRDEIPL